jgi:hypothetical protein
MGMLVFSDRTAIVDTITLDGWLIVLMFTRAKKVWELPAREAFWFASDFTTETVCHAFPCHPIVIT